MTQDYIGIYLTKVISFEKECGSAMMSMENNGSFSGVGVFYYLLHLITRDSKYLAKSIEQSTRGVKSVQDARFLQFLYKQGAADLTQVSLLANFETTIYVQSLKHIVREQYNFLEAGVGVGYAVDRFPDIKARGYLRQVVDVLEISPTIRLCKSQHQGEVDLDELTSKQMNDVIALSNVLIRVLQCGAFTEKIEPMLEICADFLYQTLDVEPIDTRSDTIWEKGVVGHLLCIFNLSRLLGFKELSEEGERIARQLVWPAAFDFSDYNFRSGAAGMLHALQCLYTMTGNLSIAHNRDLYLRRLFAYDSIYQPPASLDLLDGPLGVHVALLDTSAENHSWAEVLHPVL